MNLVKLNLGRSCLKYIIRLYGIKKLWVPYYCCDSVWHAIRQENCRLKFYHIDNDFLPIGDFENNDFILYINYFGLCENNCKCLAQKYKNLIVDNTQGFYSEHSGLASFNSLRKFFKVCSGAYLYADEVLNTNFETDKLNYKPLLIHENYSDFVNNEILLDNQNIKFMNSIIESQIQLIDFERDKEQRINLYNQYDKIFGDHNLIHLKLSYKNIPYGYPFSCNNPKIIEKIQKSGLILLRLWKNIPKNSIESEMLYNVALFPVNDKEYANKIISLFKQ